MYYSARTLSFSRVYKVNDLFPRAFTIDDIIARYHIMAVNGKIAINPSFDENSRGSSDDSDNLDRSSLEGTVSATSPEENPSSNLEKLEIITAATATSDSDISSLSPPNTSLELSDESPAKLVNCKITNLPKDAGGLPRSRKDGKLQSDPDVGGNTEDSGSSAKHGEKIVVDSEMLDSSKPKDADEKSCVNISVDSGSANAGSKTTDSSMSSTTESKSPAKTQCADQVPTKASPAETQCADQVPTKASPTETQCADQVPTKASPAETQCQVPIKASPTYTKQEIAQEKMTTTAKSDAQLGMAITEAVQRIVEKLDSCTADSAAENRDSKPLKAKAVPEAEDPAATEETSKLITECSSLADGQLEPKVAENTDTVVACFVEVSDNENMEVYENYIAEECKKRKDDSLAEDSPVIKKLKVEEEVTNPDVKDS